MEKKMFRNGRRFVLNFLSSFLPCIEKMQMIINKNIQYLGRYISKAIIRICILVVKDFKLVHKMLLVCFGFPNFTLMLRWHKFSA